MKRLMFLITALLMYGFLHLSLDQQLREAIYRHNVQAFTPQPQADSAKIELGRMLFYDKILSGNKDISCASCHHPQLSSGDALRLPIGVGGKGLGTEREMGEDRDFVPRNSPEIFNRGSKEWHSMFWDSRVELGGEEGIISPADEKLPGGLENLLAVQAMFPVTSRDEMRGEIGDVDINGEENELALISPAMPQSIWFALMERLRAIPAYVEMFNKVYPDIKTEDLGFQHAANAIAAYETSAFTYLDSPWDQYLEGEESALTEAQKRGALLFYNDLGCASCHTGSLMTDQQHHNIGVPQFGPGRGDAAPLDIGRFDETGNPEDLFAFRTPPLRNVALTGPWMHNGAYENLEDAIRHHFDPETALRNFSKANLPQALQETHQDHGRVINRIVETLDPLETQQEKNVSDKDIQDLLSFMEALTEKSAAKGITKAPESVPSGLPVDKLETE